MDKAPSEAIALDLLRLARRHVRSHARPAGYFERGDRFASVFLGRPLGVSADDSKTVGTDLAVVLDTFYEDTIQRSPGELALLGEGTRHLGRFVDVSVAVPALAQLRSRLDADTCPLLDVAAGLLAAITALGYEALVVRTSAEVAGDWLDLWRRSVAAHNEQQELHTALCMLQPLSPAARSEALKMLDIPASILQPDGGTFLAGVRRYLATFSESGAAAMVLVGALPFARRLTSGGLARMIAFLQATPELLALLGGMLRLAQDMKLDHSEPVSTGVFALAAEQNAGILTLDTSRLPADLEQRLRMAWEVYYPESRRRLDALLAGLAGDGEDEICLAVRELVGTTCAVAQALVTPSDDAGRA